MKPEVIREPSEIQQRLLVLKRQGKTVCVVPTMGALHAGHRALIVEGRKRADVLVVTIFVNPTQFGPNEDLDKYPRTLDADAAMCEAEGVDLIFFPTNDMMYPEHYTTYVDVERLGNHLCGASRPGHFRGVTTVVTKLFLITQADVAVFGWKDAQQQLILRRMVLDLNIPVKIVGVETVREEDGLAFSSRNIYLGAEARAEAPVLYRALCEARRQIVDEGERNAIALRQGIIDQIQSESSGSIDYVEIVSTHDFSLLEKIRLGETLIALAVKWEVTRLIDNVRV